MDDRLRGLYVLDSDGYARSGSTAEIDDKYYARIALEPRRLASPRATPLTVPPARRQSSATGDSRGTCPVGTNRLFRYLCYDAVTTTAPPRVAASTVGKRPHRPLTAQSSLTPIVLTD